MHRDVFDGYRDLLGPEQFDDLIRPAGHLYLWRQEPRGLGDVLGRELRDRQGIRSVMLRGGEIQEAEPQLNSGFAVGMLLPDNGYTVNSERLVKALAANFTAAGGVLGRRNVLGFKDGSLGPEALYTDCGSIAVGGAKLVIAAGAWSVRLADKLFGHSISLETERGYHVMLRSPSIQPRRPIMDCSRKFIATPMEHGLRVAGTVEIGGLDAPPDYRRAEALVSHAHALLRNLEFEEKSVWMGFRPSTSDSLPVIDQSKKFPNVYAAFGHGHLGMTGGPGTARLLGEIVAGKPATIDRSPFRIDRF
ncbi:MAG: NAD(P)/FAD-dependent oxidoreductase [Pollutimonas bauzanensis]